VKRFVLTTALVALGMAPLSLAQAHGDKQPTHSGHSAPTAERHREYKPSEKFAYNKHGRKNFSWSHSHWSEYYHRYCYWASNYGWCFYEPTYACYVPVSNFFEVYPDAAASYAPPVARPTGNITQQQTTVVTAPAAAAAPAPLPEPPSIAIIAPPTAVQQTKVGAGAP
jgi:hypothetical protein